MKKLFILSLATLGFVACSKRADYIVLSGKIDGYNGAPLKIIGGDFNADLHVNPADGTFRDTLKVNNNYYYYTIANPMYGIQVPIYLEKGSQVDVNINLSSNPIGATFTGDDAAINSYLQKKQVLSFEFQDKVQDFFSQKPEEFQKSIVEVGKKYLDLLNGEKELSKKFVTLEAKNINYELLYFKNLYEGAHQQLTKEAAKLPKEIADELSRLDYDLSKDFEIYNFYKLLVNDNLDTKIEHLEDGDISFAKAAKYIETLKSENIKNALSRQFVNAISVMNTPKVNNELIEIVKANVKDSVTLAVFNKRVEALERLKEGKDFPAFEAEDANGNIVTYESLKGKLLYIDIWATWCAPCRAEIPALKALQEEYKGKDLTFVSISVDQDKDKWKDFVAKEGLTGVQLYENIAIHPDFAEKYELSGIPRFILVDKEGKIISIAAPTPSNPKIKELINAHL